MNTQYLGLVRPLPRLLLTSVIAVGFAAGCNKEPQHHTATASNSAVGEVAPAAPAATQPQHVRLTGCLQQGKRGAYILTDLSEPTPPDSSKPGVVAREKLAAAEEAYRLSSSDNHQMLAALVGNRVRVDGNVSKQSDLMTDRTDRDRAAGTAGQSDEIKAIESGRVIRQADLAQVDVSSIEKVADACSEHSAGARR
jgi:hypothetical protein